MTLRRLDANRVRLVECPFCQTDLEGRPPSDHLENCDRFREMWAQ